MKDLIKVYDDVVPLPLANQTEAAFQSESFPWFWNDATVNIRLQDFPQLVHPFRLESLMEWHELDMFNHDRQRAYNCAKGIIERIQESNDLEWGTIHRIKANLTWPNRQKLAVTHTDMNASFYYSTIYYINDADGDTVFFSEGNDPENEIARVSPKKGRFVTFPSNISHAGECPTNTRRRMVLNYVYTVTNL